MPLQAHELYALKSGIDDEEKFILMKVAWIRITFRVRDYNSCIKFNRRSYKRKVCEEHIGRIADEITKKAHEFEEEFKIPYKDNFRQMLKR